MSCSLMFVSMAGAYLMGALFRIIEQCALKIVNNCFNTNIYSYLVISSGKSFNIYLKVVCFLTPVLIRYLWQLKTVISLIGE